MKNTEFYEISMRRAIKIGNAKLCELERVIRRSDGEQHCFYCNFSLKCGQHECIWGENYA